MRRLEVREPISCELAELLAVRRSAGLEDHERMRCFAPLFVWHADHRRFLDRRMPQQHALDLDRLDVFATADDHVLDAVADFDVAVWMHDSRIAGMEPTARESAFGRLRIV